MGNFRSGVSFLVVNIIFFLYGINTSEAINSVVDSSKISSGEAYGFIENKGQLGSDATFIKYYYQTDNFALYLTDSGLIYKYVKFENRDKSIGEKSRDLLHKPKLSNSLRAKTEKIIVRFAGANDKSQIHGEEQRKDIINFYNKSTLGVKHFDKVVYENFYPGIDWVIYSFENRLKYDFIVHPGANPDQIKMVFTHNGLIQLKPDGGYMVKSNLGTISETKPIAVQKDKNIPIQFTLNGDTIGFKIGDYDDLSELVIDPELMWATYFGGSYNDYSYGVSSDSIGNVYMTGETYSFSNIAYGGFQNTIGNTETYYGDAFLVKYSSSGDRLWSTYYGGNDHDEGRDVEVDGDGNIYMGGIMGSWIGDIASSGAHQASQGGWIDAFLVKFNSDGIRLWGTYIGGIDEDNVYSLASDENNNIYVAGSTSSPNAIALNGHQSQLGASGICGFMQKYSPTGQLLWGTYYGLASAGDGSIAFGCAVDNDGNPYMSGVTTQTEGISYNGFQNSLSGNLTTDAFLVKFNSEGVRLWGTYYGGEGEDEGYDCSADAQGNVYLCGNSPSTQGIAFNGHQNEMGGIGGNWTDGDAFLVKFDSEGNRLWATYYGGENDDIGYSCDVNENGGVYLSGVTKSATQISSPGAFSESHGNPGIGLENRDMFLVKFNDSGQREWGTYYGRTLDDHGGVCHAGINNAVYLCGITNSTNLAQDGFQDFISGEADGVLAKFNDNDCFVSSSISVSSCDTFMWSDNGVAYTVSGDYSTTLTSGQGCDSLVMLSLTINSSTQSEDIVSACENYIWPPNGETYSSSGSYTYTMSNAAGCDSVISLDLSIHNSEIFESDSTVCDSLYWPATGLTYFSSDQLSFNKTNIYGCDSTLVLNLTVYSSTSSSSNISACDSYYWPENGDTYSVSGNYLTTLASVQGCDSTVRIELTINSSTQSEDVVAVCENYVWPLNGQTYTSSGSYFYTTTNALGCDSVITLELSVHNPDFLESDLTVCDSLFWQATGETYFSSEQLTANETNMYGCDSTLVLNLTVNASTYDSSNVSACDSYYWTANGQNYASEGIYTQVLTNSQGCDSTLILNLSIDESTFNLVEQKTCAPYYWPVNGQTYSETGFYSASYTTSTGCDSTLTLNLEVEPIEIISQPENANVQVGKTATFTIQTQLQNNEYQWQVNGMEGFLDLENLSPYMGVHANTLEINKVTFAQANLQFRCIISNQACSDTSRIADLKVSILKALIYPNPNNGNFTLAIPGELTGSLATIYDDQAKVIMKIIIDNQFTEFDLSNFASGVYQVVIPNIETLRLVISR